MDSIHAHYVTRKYLAYVQLCIDLNSFPEEDGLGLVHNCKDSISSVMLNCAMAFYL